MPTLPETSPRPALGCPHFPARFQALIFRNWGVVPCARIARALGCSLAEARAAAEKSMATGKPMKKWPKVKENPLANKLFGKLAAAYTAIGMNDAMHEAVINRYCIITAECEALETRQEALRAAQENQDTEKTAQLESAIAKIDAALNVRRNMLLAIERENLLTIASKLRAVPKKPQESEEEDPMERVLLQGRRGG